MDCQDWNTIQFSNKQEKLPEKKSNNTFNPHVKSLEAPSNLGKLISQARNIKNLSQKDLSLQLGISNQILSRWEASKENPNNQQIANIEKKLGIKLPRCKKVLKTEDL